MQLCPFSGIILPAHAQIILLLKFTDLFLGILIMLAGIKRIKIFLGITPEEIGMIKMVFSRAILHMLH